MTPEWAGEAEDRRAARAAAAQREQLRQLAVGQPIVIANEFTEVRITRIDTRNGARLMIESPKSGQWVTLDPLELESLTWQNQATFSALVGNPFGPLVQEESE